MAYVNPIFWSFSGQIDTNVIFEHNFVDIWYDFRGKWQSRVGHVKKKLPNSKYLPLKNIWEIWPDLTLFKLIGMFKPRIIGRYAFGREEKIVLSDMSTAEVDQAVASLANGPSTWITLRKLLFITSF